MPASLRNREAEKRPNAWCVRQTFHTKLPVNRNKPTRALISQGLSALIQGPRPTLTEQMNSAT